VRAVGDEAIEPRPRVGDGVGRGDADGVEAELAGGLVERAPQRRRVVQKSRSA
jgi:hypothetical protein